MGVLAGVICPPYATGAAFPLELRSDVDLLEQPGHVLGEDLADQEEVVERVEVLRALVPGGRSRGALDLPDRTGYNRGRQLERIAWRHCQKRSAGWAELNGWVDIGERGIENEVPSLDSAG